MIHYKDNKFWSLVMLLTTEREPFARSIHRWIFRNYFRGFLDYGHTTIQSNEWMPLIFTHYSMTNIIGLESDVEKKSTSHLMFFFTVCKLRQLLTQVDQLFASKCQCSKKNVLLRLKNIYSLISPHSDSYTPSSKLQVNVKRT